MDSKDSLADGDADWILQSIEAHWCNLERFLQTWKEQQEGLMQKAALAIRSASAHSTPRSATGAAVHSAGVEEDCAQRLGVQTETSLDFLGESEQGIRQQAYRNTNTRQGGIHKSSAALSCFNRGDTMSSTETDFNDGIPKTTKVKIAKVLGLQRDADVFDLRLDSLVGSRANAGVTFVLRTLFGQILRSSEEKTDAGSLTARLVKSRGFETMTAMVIFANAATLALSADHAVQNPKDPHNKVLATAETAFCIFYVVEWCIRFWSEKLNFFFGPDRNWNIFDTVLMGSGVHDQVDYYFDTTASNDSNVSFLRMLRFLKMLKLLRLVRLLKFFRQLRLIVRSMLTSITSTFWSAVLIILVTYIFGILLLQLIGNFLAENVDSVEAFMFDNLMDNWGSLPKAMTTLYYAGTGGEDWHVYADPLGDVGWECYGFFLVYITFFLFIVTNTITSLFVEAMFENSSRDEQLIIHDQLSRRDEYVAKIQGLFTKMDDDGSGDVSYAEFERHLSDEEMVAFCSSLEIDATDVAQFFNILSAGGTRSVDVETFVIGCIKLKGVAKSMDLMDLAIRQRNHFRDSRAIAMASHEKLVALCHIMDPLAKYTKDHSQPIKF